jgi:hypothetical protein
MVRHIRYVRDYVVARERLGVSARSRDRAV